MGGECTSSLQRHCVSDVPFWTTDIALSTDFRKSLLHDIDSLIDSGKVNEYAYGLQTNSLLQKQTAKHWKFFFAEFQTALLGILQMEEFNQREMTIFVRAWASRSDELTMTSQSARIKAIHQHSPATLSSIFYLKLPTEQEAEDYGTVFLNPHAPVLPGARPGTYVTPQEGTLVIFPSWLHHSPIVPTKREGLSFSRYVVSTDVYFLPKGAELVRT